MARTFEENMNDKRLTVKSLRVLQDVEGSVFEKISAEIEETNQSIASLQGVQDRYWASIADDNIISIEEKRALYKEKQTLDTEYSIVIQNAEKNKDYVDYSGLITAYDNLNKYLAFIKVFESMSTNTKIDNRAEFYDAFDNYYIALNNVNQSILNKTSIGDLNVDNPDKITGLKAVARENDIYVSFNALETSIKNSIQKYIYKLNKGDGVWLLFETQVNGFSYEFNRLIDGFPEAEELAKWEWCVSAVSVYGKENKESNITTVNVDNYGTWIPTTPKIDKATNKRQVSMTFSQPITSRILYGEIQYGITIRKQGETTFYTPELDKDPRENVNNYKKSTTTSHFVTSYFSQTLPLSGQNNTKWKKKYHEITQGSSVEKNVSTSYLTNINSESIPSNATKEYDSSGNLIKVKFSKSSGSITMYYEYTLVDMPSPVDTTYQYKIIVKNITTNKEYSSLIANPISLVATANGVGDLVDNAITQNALAPDAVTADKIAAGTVTADKIAAENILAKGARAGMVSTEGLQVDDSGFFASEPFNYKYHDPETGAEKTYTTSAGEFFVGNSPDINDSRDVSEFLHYKKGEGGGFWLKIKNFIVKGLSTIINGVFVVKKTGETDSNAFFVANATDSADSTTGVAERTLSLHGGFSIWGEAYDSVSATDSNPHIEFANRLKQQTLRLVYTDYNSIHNPASLHLIGSQGDEAFFAPNVFAKNLCKRFYNPYTYENNTSKYNWFKIFESKSYNVSIGMHIFVANDCNTPYVSEYSLFIQNYSSSSYFSLSISLTKISNNCFPNQSSLMVAVDKDFNVYVQAQAIWDSGLYILPIYNKKTSLTLTKLSSSSFGIDPSDFTSYKKIKDNGAFRISKSNDSFSLNFLYEGSSQFPVGFIYMSVNSTSPATLFGGYWVRLKDRFLLGAGDTYSAGATGGASSHTLTKAQIPRHSHTINHDHTISNLLFTAPSSSYTYKWDQNAVGGIYGKVEDAYTGYGGSSSEVGSGESFSIMPLYTVVYMWKRVTEEEAATLSIT